MRDILVAVAGAVLIAGATAGTLPDETVRQAIIQASIASYPSVCACPYSVMRNGRACGRRSAYNRLGGYAPLCYASDVTPAMIAEYRAAHGP